IPSRAAQKFTQHGLALSKRFFPNVVAIEQGMMKAAGAAANLRTSKTFNVRCIISFGLRSPVAVTLATTALNRATALLRTHYANGLAHITRMDCMSVRHRRTWHRWRPAVFASS